MIFYSIGGISKVKVIISKAVQTCRKGTQLLLIAPWHFIERSGNGIAFRAIHIESKEEAPNAPTPFTNYALFRDGEYITNEQMNDKKFLKLRIRKLVPLGKIQNYMKDFEILLMNKRKKV